MTTKTDKTMRPRGEDTRRRLVDAAYAQFLQNGYHGTSMRQIAQAAGMAVGGIYNHFASKEEVFAEVLDQYHPYHAILPALEAAQGDSAEAFLRHLTSQVQQTILAEREKLLPLIYIELVEFQGRHIQALAARVLPTVVPLLTKFADRRDQLRPLPLPVIQRAFLGMMVGYYFTDFLLSTTPPLADERVDWLEGVLDVFLHGVLKDPA
jgi:AcrR family transcriptional regulator